MESLRSAASFVTSLVPTMDDIIGARPTAETPTQRDLRISRKAVMMFTAGAIITNVLDAMNIMEIPRYKVVGANISLVPLISGSLWMHLENFKASRRAGEV